MPQIGLVAIAVVIGRAALAVRGTGGALDFKLHQALRGKTLHLAWQIGIELFSSSVRRLTSLVIIGAPPVSVEGLATNLPEIRDDHRDG